MGKYDGWRIRWSCCEITRQRRAFPTDLKLIVLGTLCHVPSRHAKGPSLSVWSIMNSTDGYTDPSSSPKAAGRWPLHGDGASFPEDKKN